MRFVPLVKDAQRLTQEAIFTTNAQLPQAHTPEHRVAVAVGSLACRVHNCI